MSNDASVYVWGCYAIGLALPATELALLRVRSRLIRQHLGWGRRYAEATAPSAAGAAPGERDDPESAARPARPGSATAVRQEPAHTESD